MLSGFLEQTLDDPPFFIAETLGLLLGEMAEGGPNAFGDMLVLSAHWRYVTVGFERLSREPPR
jgi:hypothetical protein